MASYLFNDAALYVSKLPETSINTMYSTGSDFLKAASTNPVVILPNVETVNDAGKPGNGYEFATYECVTYTTHPAVGIADDINFELAGRLLLRSLGGTVTATQQGATTAYKHTCNMYPVASGTQLPTSTVISELGGVSFLMGGFPVQSYTLSQTRADRPKFSCDLVGSGKFTTPHGVTSLPATATITSCLDGNSSQVQWTDADGTTDFTSGTCHLRSWSCGVNNNIKLNDRCPGDSTNSVTATYGTATPAYVSTMKRGNRVVTAQIVETLDSTIPNWKRHAVGEVVTNVIFRARGPVIASSYRYTLGFTIPKAIIKAVTTGEDNGDAILTYDLEAIYDSTSGGALTGECTNTTTSNFK